jgi:hypothetical protein
VWVDVPVEIDDRKAASYSKNRRASHIDAGYQLLDGEHALTFVRSRDYPDADFTRMKNQQLFFRSLADQVAKKQNVIKAPRMIAAIQPYVQTDMRLMDMIRTAQALKSAGSKRLYTATVQGEWRSPYVWADEDQLKKALEAFNAGRPFDATATVEGATAVTGSENPTIVQSQPKDITVTVRNGAGISGCAKQASSILKARRFNVTEVGNANQFVYENTTIVYKSNRSAAEKVAEVLPPGAKLVESRGMYSFKTDVLVVIGKDWDLERVPVARIMTE